jgi:hypothetical protein
MYTFVCVCVCVYLCAFVFVSGEYPIWRSYI